MPAFFDRVTVEVVKGNKHELLPSYATILITFQEDVVYFTSLSNSVGRSFQYQGAKLAFKARYTLFVTVHEQ